MIVIPQRLFADPNVTVLARDGQNAILHKCLDRDLIRREAYIANHAISIVLRGEQTLATYEDNYTTLKAGEMVLLPRGVYYVTDLKAGEDAFESLLFYFDDDAVRDFVSTLTVPDIDRAAAPEFLQLPQPNAVRSFADNVLNIYGNLNVTDEMLRLKTLELLHLVNAAVPHQRFANFLFRLTLPRRRDLRRFMETHATKPLSVEDYAYLSGRSMTTFRRDFKDYYNTTPQRWIKEQRIKHAVNLLDQREMPVVDLAAEAGYQNVSYFIRAFKAQTGHSPKQYMLARRAPE